MLRLNEHYTSIQGEGPRTGILTQFVRFAGCNMRCPGWPCDTPHAIDPKIWKDEHEKLTVDEVLNRVLSEAKSTGANNICLTGGEPLMQGEAEILMLVNALDRAGCTTEIFTNGSFPIARGAYPPDCIFMMDWKLPGSGEAETGLEVRKLNAQALLRCDGIKFVVKDEGDIHCAETILARTPIGRANVWVGAAWGHITDNEIVEYIKKWKLPWRLNVQMHKYLWPADARRT